MDTNPCERKPEEVGFLSKKVLMVFIEPTPYLIDLIREVRLIWKGGLDVLFVRQSHTQNWSLTLGEEKVFPSNGLLSILAVIYQRLYKEKYSFIFLAGWSSFACLAFLFLAKISSIPTSVDSDTFLSSRTPKWKAMIKKMLYPILFKLPTICFPAGTRQAQYFRYYGVPAHKIIHEKMTVDILKMQQYFKQLTEKDNIVIREELGLKENDFVFLNVGRLIECKGIRLLLEAFSKIDNVKLKLIVVGDGPLRKEVEEKAEEINTIKYLGRLEGEKLLNLYYTANAFVLPSYRDQWGLVINEAMAAGKPVIVSSEVGCADDLVMDGQTGLVMKELSSEELIKHMLFLYNHPDICTKMSAEALNLISNWTIQEEANIIVNTWSRFL